MCGGMSPRQKPAPTQVSDEIPKLIETLLEAERRLVEFTAKVEKNSGATGRLLWSESEENLAQKLIARLQKVN